MILRPLFSFDAFRACFLAPIIRELWRLFSSYRRPKWMSSLRCLKGDPMCSVAQKHRFASWVQVIKIRMEQPFTDLVFG
ncbi:MAG: hypothetical protein ACJAYR_001432 [Sneathiella sp.]|jgi:hypothetical protein